MKILIVEPFYGGSHRQWMVGYQQSSSHDVLFLTLPARHWKWRMHGGAITLADRYKQLGIKPDLIVVSDFLDLTTFKSILQKELLGIPVYIYFHENQITYPWSIDDQDVNLKRDRHYGFINYSSALVADRVLFNSDYHLQSFLIGLHGFLKPYPDYNNWSSIDAIRDKSEVLHLGINLQKLDRSEDHKMDKPKWPVILWNHRWEYDKNPEQFFEWMIKLKERDVQYKLVILGESTSQSPEIFEKSRKLLNDEILHWGYCEDEAEYSKWLWISDILPVTSIQDFFGISIIEAVYCDTFPLLPDRLVYSEHFPDKYQSRSLFYTDEIDFLDKMQQYCLDVNTLRSQHTRQLVDQYDWSVMVSQYDRLFLNANKKK